MKGQKPKQIAHSLSEYKRLDTMGVNVELPHFAKSYDLHLQAKEALKTANLPTRFSYREAYILGFKDGRVK